MGSIGTIYADENKAVTNLVIRPAVTNLIILHEGTNSATLTEKEKKRLSKDPDVDADRQQYNDKGRQRKIIKEEAERRERDKAPLRSPSP